MGRSPNGRFEILRGIALKRELRTISRRHKRREVLVMTFGKRSNVRRWNDIHHVGPPPPPPRFDSPPPRTGFFPPRHTFPPPWTTLFPSRSTLSPPRSSANPLFSNPTPPRKSVFPPRNPVFPPRNPATPPRSRVSPCFQSVPRPRHLIFPPRSLVFPQKPLGLRIFQPQINRMSADQRETPCEKTRPVFMPSSISVHPVHQRFNPASSLPISSASAFPLRPFRLCG
jgi:hypothetical protein